MQFRLVYQGPLPSNRHKDYKHAIRQKLHYQLAELWKVNRYLAGHLATGDKKTRALDSRESVALFDEYARFGYRFVPLLGGRFSRTACELDILFLRRDAPGNLITTGSGGGDIDNRIKVLFDALRMPQERNELGGHPEDGEDPFFCLLKDDNLITDVRVTTDRLLTPLASGEHVNDVHLVIHVRTRVTEHIDLGGYSSTQDNYEFAFS